MLKHVCVRVQNVGLIDSAWFQVCYSKLWCFLLHMTDWHHSRVCLCVFLSLPRCRPCARIAALVAFAAPSLDILVWGRANHRLKTFSFHQWGCLPWLWGREKKPCARQYEPISLIRGPSRTQRASLDGWLARLADHWLVIDAAWSLSISHSYVIHQPFMCIHSTFGTYATDS